jgi:hypothetical protein
LLSVPAAATAISDTSAPKTPTITAATPVLAPSPTVSTLETRIRSVEVVGQPPSTLSHDEDLTSLATIKENEKNDESQPNKVRVAINFHT